MGKNTTGAIVCALAVTACLGLAGCGASQGHAGSTSRHQIIGASDACGSCHSDDRTGYPAPAETPADALAVGSSVVVSTDADRVVVCAPEFGTEDGSFVVPRESRSQKVEDGQATIELEDGVWVLCAGDAVSPKAQLVVVDEADGESVEITL